MLPDGVTIMKMPWGKYRGKDIEDIPSSYLRWLTYNCEDDEIQQAAEQEHSWRTEWHKHFEE